MTAGDDADADSHSQEFDHRSLGPETSSVDVPTVDDADADKVLLRTFWGSVLSLNVAMTAVPLGLLLVYFRGDWELGGLAVAVGCVAAAATVRFYRRFRADRRGGDDP
ncbi:hypothetical protein BRC88_01715 [Halobacteriales archaeon QS_4_69_225]|nr:MAG: hypothetical protein BRC88_01715 [Halobacteriales archaeon QS_4_69_225]